MNMPEADPPAAVAAGPLVVIAEDEADNQMILQTIVEMMVGCRTVLVDNGQALLEAVRREPPALILVDLMMPILDGFSAARQIRDDPATCHIPILAISAMARPDDRELALAAGCDDFVRKPFDIDALEALIRARLPPLPRPPQAPPTSAEP